MTYDLEYYKKSADYVKSKIDFTPEIGIVLGTALGALADEIENKVIVDYKDIPNFLQSTVGGHDGKLILGTLSGKKVVCMAGRFHYYEGYSFEALATPMRLFKLLGVSKIMLTNAAGAINMDFKPGDIMIIKDHINLTSVSPMRGPNIPEFGKRFFAVCDMYAKDLRAKALECAKSSSLTIHEGVYHYYSGPHFETPTEIKAMRILGADAVGMSTVPEALTAAHCGIPVLGISVMTNMAAGILETPLDGEHVEAVARSIQKHFKEYVKDIISKF